MQDTTASVDKLQRLIDLARNAIELSHAELMQKIASSARATRPVKRILGLT